MNYLKSYQTFESNELDFEMVITAVENAIKNNNMPLYDSIMKKYPSIITRENVIDFIVDDNKQYLSFLKNITLEYTHKEIDEMILEFNTKQINHYSDKNIRIEKELDFEKIAEKFLVEDEYYENIIVEQVQDLSDNYNENGYDGDECFEYFSTVANQFGAWLFYNYYKLDDDKYTEAVGVFLYEEYHNQEQEYIKAVHEIGRRCAGAEGYMDCFNSHN